MVNFCLGSGFSVLVVFVSFLCAILASAFYKYTTSQQQMSLNDSTSDSIDHEYENSEKQTTITAFTEQSLESSIPLISDDEQNNTNNHIPSTSDNDMPLEETETDNGNELDPEQTPNMFIDSIEGTEEEIQKQQIANIYRLLNDQNLTNNWTTSDFFDQLKMYGFQPSDENEPDLS